MPGGPSLNEIFQLLTQIYDIVRNDQIERTTMDYAQDASYWSAIAAADTRDPVYGLSALHADIAALQTYVDERLDTVDINVAGVYAATQAIIDDIADIPAGTDYTQPLADINASIGGLNNATQGPDEYAIAAAVWDWDSAIFYLDGSNYNLNMMQVAEVAASRGLIDQAYYGVPLPECPFFSLCVGRTDAYGPSGWAWNSLSMSWKPAWPVWTNVLATDTPYTFLARTQPSYSWSLTGPGGVNDGHTAWKDIGSGGGTHPWVRSNFTELEMQQLAALTPEPPTPTEPPPAAPVWPGSAAVDLGTPVALVDQSVITGPMHGLLVDITTPPQKLGSYRVGTKTLDYSVGRITFEDDSGHLEPWQYLGFREAIYAPRSMAVASKARIQLLGGAEGTATPWNRS